jgi:hypothetical protein
MALVAIAIVAAVTVPVARENTGSAGREGHGKERRENGVSGGCGHWVVGVSNFVSLSTP